MSVLVSDVSLNSLRMQCVFEFIQWKKVLVRTCHLLLVFGVIASLVFQPSGKNLTFTKNSLNHRFWSTLKRSFRSLHGFVRPIELYLLSCLWSSCLCFTLLLLHDLLYWPWIRALPKSTTDLFRTRWWKSCSAIRLGTGLDRTSGLGVWWWGWCSTRTTTEDDK